MTFERLENKRLEKDAEFPNVLGFRARRCISWLGRAEKEMKAGDYDAAFIFYWIAFNAAYADSSRSPSEKEVHTKEAYAEYFKKIIWLDAGKSIFNAIWPDPWRRTRPDRSQQALNRNIRSILENQYVFGPFWDQHNGLDGGNWRERFDRSCKAASRFLAKQDTATVLSMLFDRLYVLRNQLVHGGATWDGSVNRKQVEDGARIMAFLIPLFIELMMENLAENWGKPYYPVVD